MVALSLPSRLVIKVEEPPPSQLSTSVHPSSIIMVASSFMLIPEDTGCWRPSLTISTRLPSAFRPSTVRGARLPVA